MFVVVYVQADVIDVTTTIQAIILKVQLCSYNLVCDILSFDNMKSNEFTKAIWIVNIGKKLLNSTYVNVSHRVLVTSPTLADRPGRQIIISSEVTGQIQQLHFFQGYGIYSHYFII